MAEYVVAQAAVLIVPTLGKGANEFHKKLDAELQKQRHEIEVHAKAQTAKMLAQIKLAKEAAEEDPIKIKVDTVDVTKKLTEIRHKYEDISREMKKALIVDLKVTGMTLLPQLASGLAAANASMVQLSQSALLLPGILSGVAASVASLFTGVSGLKAAFKEYSDAQKNAASEGQKARNAALNVNNAYRDLNRTIKDAQRSLEDLNAQLRDAPLDEADAIIRVQEARAEAADKYEKSALQQQKDALNVVRAENELANTRLRNSRLIEDVATANAKGVQGNDAVVDATERLSKALDDAATKAEKLGDSMKLLSPNAQSFLKTLQGMQGQWTALKNATQDKLFAGLGAEVAKLAQSDLPLLQTGLSNIAGEINGNLKTAMNALQTDSNKGFLERIFGNTATAQGALDRAITPLTDGFLRLSAVGSDFLPRLSDGLADVLQRFENFIVRADGDGSLDKWVNNGIDAFKELGNSLINIGSILNSISEAFIGSGGTGMLGSLEQGTKKLAEFLKSAEGQEKLQQFFQHVREELAQWKPLLDALPGLLLNVSQAGQAWANIFLPILTNVGSLLKEHPGLVTAIFSAYVAWNGIVPIIKGVKSAIDLVNTGLDLFQRKTDETGKKITGSSGFKGKIDSVIKTLGSGGGLVTAITVAASYLAYTLVDAHNQAAQAAQRQKDELDRLAGSLDSVTGKATDATKALIGKNLTTAVNEGTGQTTNNLRELFSDPTKATEYTQKLAAGDVNGALAAVPGGMTAQAVENTDGWKNHQDSLKAAGLTSQVVADAVNGQPDAKKKFEDWYKSKIRMPGLSDEQSQGVYNLTPHFGKSRIPNLLDLQNTLSEKDRLASILRGETYSFGQNINAGGANIRAENQNAQGRYRLSDGSPFASLGPVDQSMGVSADRTNAGLTVRSMPTGAALEALTTDGVTFAPDGMGGFKVSIPPDKIGKYLVPYAAGGQISGPGTGTSDSILARLSHGEFVVNAKSTAQNLPLLEKINKGGMPRYAGGGPVGQQSDQTWRDQEGKIHTGSTSELPTGFDLWLAQKATGTGVYNPAMAPWLWGTNSGGQFNPNMKLDTSHISTPWVGGGGRFASGGLVFPRYAGGGAVLPLPKAPSPTPAPPKPTPSPSSFLDLTKSPGSYAKQIDSSGAVPRTDMRPGDFNRSEFQSAGQAQAARRGIDTKAKAAEYTASQGPGLIGRAIAAVGKGLGVVPGYTQTRTATVSTADSAWTTMRAPAPAKPTIERNVLGTSNSVGKFFGLDSEQLSKVVPFGKSPTAPAPPPPADIKPVTPPAKGPAAVATVHGSGGQPGPSGQKSTPGFPVFGSPYGGLGNTGRIPAAVSRAAAPVPTTPSVSVSPAGTSVTLPLGPQAAVTLNMTGSGALPDTAITAASRAANAQIIPDANIIDYLTTAAQNAGIGVGATKDVNHGGTHAADGGQHSVNRAADLGSLADAQSGRLSEFVRNWMSDPAKVAATRQLIFRGPDGDYGIINGRVLTGDELQQVYGADLPMHPDHIHIALEGVPITAAMNNPLQYLAPASPSNIAPAMTPTGVRLPQLSYAPDLAAADDGGKGGFKLPTPEEWFKSVAESWQGILENLVKNAGSIALKMIGSFFGIDLSPILDIANSVMGNNGLGDMFGDGKKKKDGKDADLPANPTVDEIMATLGQLPPQYQQIFSQQLQAQGGSPDQAYPLLQQVMALAQQQMAGGANQIALTPDSKPAEVAAAIVAAGKARGYSRDEILAVLATAYGESAWNPRADGGIQPGPEGSIGEGDRAVGVFQQKPRYWKNPQDPNQNIANFLDALDKTKGSSGSVFDRIVSFQGGPPASYYASFLPQAQQVLMNMGGFASGGQIKGPGNGRSDSIIARVSNGEYIVSAPMAAKHYGLLHAINSGKLPGYAEGGVIPPVPITPGTIGAPPPPPPPPPTPATPPPMQQPSVSTPEPVPSPVADPLGVKAAQQAGQTAPGPAADAPLDGVQVATDALDSSDPAQKALETLGSALGGLGGIGGGGASGAKAPAGGDPTGDPRAVMAAPDLNLEHNKPAVSQAISGAAGAIGGAINTAMSVAAAAASAGINAQAPGAGAALSPAMSAAGSLISGFTQAVGGAVSGAVNVLSSGMVGTLTPGTTAGAYGTPLIPKQDQKSYSGPSMVNNFNGGVHTSNNEEFYKIQQRRELQASAALLPRR